MVCAVLGVSAFQSRDFDKPAPARNQSWLALGFRLPLRRHPEDAGSRGDLIERRNHPRLIETELCRLQPKRNRVASLKDHFLVLAAGGAYAQVGAGDSLDHRYVD